MLHRLNGNAEDANLAFVGAKAKINDKLALLTPWARVIEVANDNPELSSDAVFKALA